MRILVVGASGFIGRHLVPHLASEGHEVECWGRQGPSAKAVDLLGEAPLPEGTWDAVFHLAGHTRPNLGWSQDWVLENLRMTARLSDHVAECSPGCRFIFLSSGHVYAAKNTPLVEADPVLPSSPYGLSKQLSEAWVQSHARKLQVVIVRAFNQLGPGMPQGLLLPDLIARCREGGDAIHMRGRDSERDFLDIRDAVEAYGKLCSAPVPSGSIFNLCSGRPVRISVLVAQALQSMGLVRKVTFEDPASDTLTGSNDLLRSATGWSPSRSLEDLVNFAVADSPL